MISQLWRFRPVGNTPRPTEPQMPKKRYFLFGGFQNLAPAGPERYHRKGGICFRNFAFSYFRFYGSADAGPLETQSQGHDRGCGCARPLQKPIGKMISRLWRFRPVGNTTLQSVLPNLAACVFLQVP